MAGEAGRADAPAVPSESSVDPNGWRRENTGLRVWQKVTLVISAVAFAITWGLAAGRYLDLEALRGVAALLVFLGAGARMYAHDQKKQNLKFLDLYGKFLAYYSAFTVLITWPQ